MKVGSARIDITPSLGIPMGGYWGRSGGAAEIGDALYARAVVFQLGKRRCALVSLDLVSISAETVGRMRARISARTDLAPTVNNGAVTIKIINNTNITSTNGVTFISLMGSFLERLNLNSITKLLIKIF